MAIEHQDDWKHREGPRTSLGAPRKLLGKVTKVTKVTKVLKVTKGKYYEFPRTS